MLLPLGKNMDKNQMTHLFPGLRLSLPICIMAALLWLGHSEWQDN